MLSGGIDMMVEVPPISLSKFQGNDFSIAEQAGPHVWFLILNAKEGPFSNKKVRQAANYAINKEAIVKDVLEGTAAIAAGPTPPAFAWAYNNNLQPYPYNPEKAKALLNEANLSNKKLTFMLLREDLECLILLLWVLQFRQTLKQLDLMLKSKLLSGQS